MSVDDNRGLTIGLWRVIVSSHDGLFLHHPVEEVNIYVELCADAITQVIIEV